MKALRSPVTGGDAVGAYANAAEAAELLGWRTEATLDEAIAWTAKRKSLLGYE